MLERREPGRASIQKDEGPKSIEIGGYKFPISLGAENESTSRCDTAFSNLVGKERRSPSEASNEEIEESKAPMAREAHAEGARRKLRVEEQAQARKQREEQAQAPTRALALVVFSLPGPKAVQSFLAKSRIWGFLLRNFTIKRNLFSNI